MTAPFRIGTRGSPLALVQANMVRVRLIAAHDWAEGAVEIVPIKTTGDRVQDRALAEIGGKALWTKELDRALLDRDIDCAVHSMKDVETIRPTRIRIAAMLPRADVRDKLIGAKTIAALAKGARVGTSSPRRAAQLLNLRPDLKILLFRGNVATRLAKLEAGEADATLLAAAGLDRLGQSDIGHAIDDLLPAPAQGAVGIEVRADDKDACRIVDAIDHKPTWRCVMAERALLAVLGADCHSPVAALAQIEDDRLTIRAELLAEDGSDHITGDITSDGDDDAAAEALARDLLKRAPHAIAKLFAGP
jgi:hydroxymethylbilane synthase